jgi:hypothetical protein
VRQETPHQGEQRAAPRAGEVRHDVPPNNSIEQETSTTGDAAGCDMSTPSEPDSSAVPAILAEWIESLNERPSEF